MKSTILIVDDYDDTRTFMKYLLAGWGFNVLEAADGVEAIEIATSQLPDIILMDISMPIMDGLTAVKFLRESVSEISNTPILAITAFDETYQKKALAAGCNSVLAKPVDFERLESLLTQYLS